MKINIRFFVIIPLTVFFSCQKFSPDTSSDSIDTEQVIMEVESAVWAFHSADTSRNEDQVIGLIWPECSMFIDGHRISYEQMTSGSKQFMSSLTLFYTDWNDLQIIPISSDAAISSFIFRDSIINSSGVLTQHRGPNTFLWQKRNDEWRVLYGDADHYPVQ